MYCIKLNNSKIIKITKIKILLHVFPIQTYILIYDLLKQPKVCESGVQKDIQRNYELENKSVKAKPASFSHLCSTNSCFLA